MKDKWATKIVCSTNRLPWKIRKFIYEAIGFISCGGGNDIRTGLLSDHINSVKLGKHVLINQNVQFHIGGKIPTANIHIEDNVYIGMNACFICVSHVMGSQDQRAGDNVYSSIKIGKGTWIGANVTVLPGVSVGKGCVVAAGSVVISDCEKNCLYAGNPAKKKRYLGE